MRSIRKSVLASFPVSPTGKRGLHPSYCRRPSRTFGTACGGVVRFSAPPLSCWCWGFHPATGLRVPPLTPQFRPSTCYGMLRGFGCFLSWWPGRILRLCKDGIVSLLEPLFRHPGLLPPPPATRFGTRSNGPSHGVMPLRFTNTEPPSAYAPLRHLLPLLQGRLCVAALPNGQPPPLRATVGLAHTPVCHVPHSGMVRLLPSTPGRLPGFFSAPVSCSPKTRCSRMLHAGYRLYR